VPPKFPTREHDDMGVSPDVLVGHAPNAAERSSLCWRALAVGVVLCVVYFVSPEDWVLFRQVLLSPLTALAATALVVVGVRRYRPVEPWAWLFIGVGMLAISIGDLLWGVYEVRGDDPFPSVADVFYLASYPSFAFGLALATKRRRPLGVDVRAAIDAAIVSVIGGFLGYVYIVRPIIDDDSLSAFENVVLILYPVGDLLLFAVALRFVMGASWGKRALRLLVFGFLLTLVGDVMFALGTAGNLRADRLWDAVLLVAIVLMGVAPLDPSMRAFTEEAGDPAVWNDVWRLTIVFAASAMPPFVLLFQERTGRPVYVTATVVAMVVVMGLAFTRFVFMSRQSRRAFEREVTLSHYTLDLLTADGRDQLLDAARSAISAVRLHDDEVQLVVGTEEQMPSTSVSFAAPIVVRQHQVAAVVTDAGPVRLRRLQQTLTTIATELSIALERDELLIAERATTESLAAQNDRLREIDAMKDRLVSSVSHELRTPLTSMVGYLEILRDGEVGEFNAEQAHFLEIVDRNCHRLNALINDILLTSRFDSGRMTLDRSDFDLAELAAERIESMQATAAAKGVELCLTGESGDVVVYGDRMQIGQLVDNLLSNAVKFTPQGGLVSTVVAVSSEGVTMEVTDTGVGMPVDDLGSIFDRFYRASTAIDVAGTGLGLSIAKSIVEAHDGTISVASELGKGTTFRVELPLGRQGPAAAAGDGHEVTT
jgi:signal transduction histidine kinase